MLEDQKVFLDAVILIVDDETDSRRVLKANLYDQGYQIMEASLGEDAMEKARKGPDLILLDITMPGKDGFEICRRLKEDETTRDIPVIFLSAFTDTAVKTQGLEAGGVDYVSKPFDSKELLARVRTHLTLRWQGRQIKLYADHLEEMVEYRTKELKAAEHELQRDFDIQRVINSLLRHSLQNVSLEIILKQAMDSILQVSWLAFQGRGCFYLSRNGESELSLLGHRNMTDDLLDRCSSLIQKHGLLNTNALGGIAEREQCSHVVHELHDDFDPVHDHYCVSFVQAGQYLGLFNICLKKGHLPDAKEKEFLSAIGNTLASIIMYKKTEEQLLYRAFHDTLTGLPNRTMFVDRLTEAVSRSKAETSYAFATLVLDLDRFNMINESLGHQMGDKILIGIGERIKQLLGAEQFMARIGADEFAILMPELNDSNHPVLLAGNILDSMSKPLVLDGNELFINCSIGIAFSIDGYERGEDVLRDADTALHRAKLRGRARYEIFDRDMHVKARRLMEMVNDMRLALEREEFVLHYQPIIDLKRGRISGFEALIRWQHPKRGLVPPGEFIPLAEETGLILPIGEWVMRESCYRMGKLPMEWNLNKTPMLSVNLSAKQFCQEDLYEVIQGILKDTGFQPEHLKLEITESVIMENALHAVETLSKLKSLNCRLAIDDFGTGYSSLSYLHRFPVDMLKIDRSFVGNMETKDDNLEIVRTIVALAHNLRLEVVAEGVENYEQYELLKILNCEYAQGFYFARPLDAEGMASLEMGKAF